MKKKRCVRCGELRRQDLFYVNRKSSDGLQSWCKDCSRAYSRDFRNSLPGRRYRAEYTRVHGRWPNRSLEEQREYAREYRRRRYSDDPEFKERCLAASRRYRERKRAESPTS